MSSTVSLMVMPRVQFFTNSGAIAASYKVYFYESGTTTPLDTYSEYTGTTLNTNPVQLDSYGRASVWLKSNTAYTVELHDASDVLVWSVDGVSEPWNVANTLIVGDLTANTVSAKSYNNRIMADRQFGADAGAKIAAAIAALPATGGIVDATGFQGAQTWAANPFAAILSVQYNSLKNIVLLLGEATITLGATVDVPGGITIIGAGMGGVPSVYAGSFEGGTRFVYDGASDAFKFHGVRNIKMSGFSLDLTGAGTNAVGLHLLSVVGEGAPVQNNIIEDFKITGSGPGNSQVGISLDAQSAVAQEWIIENILRNFRLELLGSAIKDTGANEEANVFTGFHIDSCASAAYAIIVAGERNYYQGRISYDTGTYTTTLGGMHFLASFSGGNIAHVFGDMGASRLFLDDAFTTYPHNLLFGTVIGSTTLGSSLLQPQINVVTFSATPAFDASLGVQQITLTGDVTSSTIANGTIGQVLTIMVIQDGSGGHSFVWPTNVFNVRPISLTGSSVNIQSVVFNGTNWYSVPLDHSIATLVVAIDSTGLTAAVGTTTLYAVPASGAGQYRLSWNAKVTTVDAVSSTLGALTIVYTDPDGVAQTITAGALTSAGAIATTSTTNTTAAVLLGVPLTLNCKASTNITYAMAYISNTPGSMAYNLHIVLEQI